MTSCISIICTPEICIQAFYSFFRRKLNTPRKDLKFVLAMYLFLLFQQHDFAWASNNRTTNHIALGSSVVFALEKGMQINLDDIKMQTHCLIY